MEARVEPTGAQDRRGRDWLPMIGRRPRPIYLALAGIAVVAAVAVAGIAIWRHGKQTQNAGPPPVPVTITEAVQRDVPIYYDALGTALQSTGFTGLASVANTMSGGIVAGACAP